MGKTSLDDLVRFFYGVAPSSPATVIGLKYWIEK